MEFEWDHKKASGKKCKHGVSFHEKTRNDELRPEYKREDLGVGVRGKHLIAQKYAKGGFK